MRTVGILEGMTPVGESSGLWASARDLNQHLIFRTQAIRRLIRGKDADIEEYVTSLLSTDNIDQWFTALDLLAMFRNASTRVTLKEEHSRVNEIHKPFVMQALTKSFVEPKEEERAIKHKGKSHHSAPVFYNSSLNEPY